MIPLVDIGVDFETYYDADYNLEKMTTAEYIMDPRFEIIGVSLKLPGMPTEWVSGSLGEIHARLSQIDWGNARVIAHNARFDAAILEWRLALQASRYLCTMVGSRPHVVPYCGSQSLAAVSAHLGLGVKGTYVHKVKGLHRVDFSAEQLVDYGNYCVKDTDLACGIADYLDTILPQDEQDLIDLTLKKYIRPSLLLNTNALVARLKEIEHEKANLFDKLSSEFGVGEGEIRSRTKFAKLLGDALSKGGASLPIKMAKPSKKNPGPRTTYAFAKDDPEFKALLASPSPHVRTLVSAKIALSSSLEESRVRRLLVLAQMLGGKLPVPLVYYGAHPGRFSGDDKINLQNIPRVTRDKSGKVLKGQLRFAIEAAPGYSILAADFSNIEARLVATLSKSTALIEAFRRGEDIYSQFASKIYGYTVNKIDHPLERFVGKTCILGLGYGMGYKKFYLKMMQEGIVMNLNEAGRIVRLYRDTYPNIPALWSWMEQAAGQFLAVKGALYPSSMAGLIFAHERIILPNGMPITYPGIGVTSNGLAFCGRYGRSLLPAIDSVTGTPTNPHIPTQNVWGGMFTENVSQGLARIIATTAELKLARIGLPTALQVHDELVWHVPTVLIPQIIPVVDRIMTEAVPWLPNLPVAVEIHHGRTYGDAK